MDKLAKEARVEERRKHPRKPMTGWVEIWGESADETLNGYVSNVSLTGIAVYTKELLAPGTSILLNLHFFGKTRKESIRALRGRVISFLKIENSYQLGIHFHEPITEEREPVLFTYLTEG
jgi:hypothetical protein